MDENQQKTGQKSVMQKKVGKYVLFMNEDQLLGKGQFGIVYRALDENKKMCAVKMISMANFKQNPFDPKTKKNTEQIKREIEVMKAAQHKNLVRLYDLQQSPNNLYLIIEYCNGGNLKEYLKQQKKLSQSEAIDIFRQLCAGYKVLNDKNILHRDIKPENVLLNDGIPKFCDFGFGKVVEDDVNEATKQSYKCTPIYAAPQILLGEPYSSKGDVWSMGCLLYEMAFGNDHYPFYGKSQVQLVADQKRVIDNNLELPKNELDPLVCDIIQRMLRYHEKDRISWSDLFKHPIFDKNFDDALDNNVMPDDGDCLNKSIFSHKKTLQTNNLVEDTKVYKQNPNKDGKAQQQSAANQSDQNLNQYMDQAKQNEQDQYISSKVDKLILYYRNQGIFASITMQNFWGVKNKYNLDTYISHMIVYCLGGYYSCMLEFLTKVIDQQQFYDFNGILSKSDYKIYLSSSNIIQTREKIKLDTQAAKIFFLDIEKTVLEETQKSIDKNQNSDKQLIQDFLKFVNSQSKDYKQYHSKLVSFMKKKIQGVDYKNLDHRNSLKALNSLIIFENIDSYFPVDIYETIDMKLFYEQKLNNVPEQDLINNIKNYLSK